MCFNSCVRSYKSINISENNKDTLREVHVKLTKAVLNLQNNVITPLYRLQKLPNL